MPNYNQPLPKAPQPTRVFFDPFNSSSTGHQRAANRLSGSTSWRDSRTYKLQHQFGDRTGGGGSKHLSDLVGAGSENFGKDGRKENGGWEKGAPGLREKGWQDIRSMMRTKRKTTDDVEPSVKKRRVQSEPILEQKSLPLERPKEEAVHVAEEPKVPQIFRGLNMYLNGSTMPLVSDHRLRQLWVQHGGNASLALGRRTVTHVVLGNEGFGGGLAATKIQKENTTINGKGVKYVTAQWVLDSIENGIRQPECKFLQAEVKQKLGGAGQKSVASFFRSNTT